MTRDERAISPQAMALLNAHTAIGRDRGRREGKLAGFLWGVAFTIVSIGVLTVIL